MRWELAEAICRGRIREAWGPAWETRMPKFPHTDKERRAYEHNPVAEIDLALASANEVLNLKSWRPIDELTPAPEQEYLLSDGQTMWFDKWKDKNWTDAPQQHWSMDYYYPAPKFWQLVPPLPV